MTNDTDLIAAQAAEILGLQAAIGTVRAFVGCVDRNVTDISPEQHTREIAASFKRLAAAEARGALREMTAERDALRGAVRDYQGIVTECRDQWGDDYLWENWASTRRLQTSKPR